MCKHTLANEAITHLLPSTIKTPKSFAFEYDLKEYEGVQVAVTEFLERHKGEQT